MRRLPYGAYGYRIDEKQRRRRRFWRRFGFSLLLLVEIGLFAGVLISVLSDIYSKMPAWEELECVTGRVAHYQYYTGGKGRTDHFNIRLEDGQEFSLGSVELAAFQRDAFESWVDRGDEITLWIDREEDGVFGGTEVIEVWSDDIGYLTYESCQEARERHSRELRRFAPIFLCVSLCSIAYADRIMWKRLKREEE